MFIEKQLTWDQFNKFKPVLITKDGDQYLRFQTAIYVFNHHKDNKNIGWETLVYALMPDNFTNIYSLECSRCEIVGGINGIEKLVDARQGIRSVIDIEVIIEKKKKIEVYDFSNTEVLPSTVQEWIDLNEYPFYVDEEEKWVFAKEKVYEDRLKVYSGLVASFVKYCEATSDTTEDSSE